jgi:hypothetical protein
MQDEGEVLVVPPAFTGNPPVLLCGNGRTGLLTANAPAKATHSKGVTRVE